VFKLSAIFRQRTVLAVLRTVISNKIIQMRIQRVKNNYSRYINTV